MARTLPTDDPPDIFTFTVSRQPWMADGECRKLPASMFYIEQHAGNARAAKAVCADCPVREQCLDWATNGGPEGTGEHHGIWAGTTPRERSQLRAAAGTMKPRRQVAECGTEGGYHWHRRNDKIKCDPCTAAHAAADARRVAVRRAAA